MCPTSTRRCGQTLADPVHLAGGEREHTDVLVLRIRGSGSSLPRYGKACAIGDTDGA